MIMQISQYEPSSLALGLRQNIFSVSRAWHLEIKYWEVWKLIKILV